MTLYTVFKGEEGGTSLLAYFLLLRKKNISQSPPEGFLFHPAAQESSYRPPAQKLKGSFPNE